MDMPKWDRESQIPVGTQFSPKLIHLPAFVDVLVEHSGEREALAEMIPKPPVRIKRYKKQPTRRVRSLPIEAAVQYGLLDSRTFEATPLAHELADMEEPEIYDAFATHIMLRKGGLRVVEAAQEMELDGLRVTGDTLAQYLSDQGFRVSIHNTAINSLRMWLAKAGLFPENGRRADAWRPDPAAKERLVGMDEDMIAAIAAFTPEQMAFAKTLARLDPDDWIAANDVRDLTEAADAVRFGRASLPNGVLKPLRDAGLIEFKTGGTQSGKTSKLRTTEAFRSEVLEPFLEVTLDDLDPVLTAYYKARPDDIYTALESSDNHTKGKALEAYAVHIMRLLGLRFMAWRRRARETGYGEVDAHMAGLLGAVPTTWQVQCKNTPSSPIRLEDVAKEVGLVPLTRATHVLILANAKITTDARKYASEIMRNTPITIFLLDREDFAEIRKNPSNIGRILASHAEWIRDSKMSALSDSSPPTPPTTSVEVPDQRDW